nr:LysE family transporter [Saprospiraceae bacterium]
MTDILIHLSIGWFAAVLGALPLGLVNLNVVNDAILKGNKEAFKLSLGATAVEILYAISALIAGKQLIHSLDSNLWIQLFVVIILLIIGLLFLFKNHREVKTINISLPPFIKGMGLNFLSPQVFIYWLIAVVYLQSTPGINYDMKYLIAFILGVGFGKLITLLFFLIIANIIKAKSQNISRKINTIIGSILIGLGFIQLLRLYFNSQ